MESELLKEAMTQDCGKAIDSFRVQRLMGILPKQGKATMETIPKKDRSAFACTRYQFFLDAPFEISNRCCNVMKKYPAHKYANQTGRKAITAQMASESRLRTQVWLKNGCNAFDAKNQVSNPMSFWTEQDVLAYIREYKIPICSVYGDIVTDDEDDGQISMMSLGIFENERPMLHTTGCQRTGCMFCGFGAHREKGVGRFERLKETHPKQYDYIMRPKEEGGLDYKNVIDWINEHGNLNIRY